MKNTQIATIGLGYVGLPLAVNFAEAFVTPCPPVGGENQKQHYI